MFHLFCLTTKRERKARQGGRVTENEKQKATERIKKEDRAYTELKGRWKEKVCFLWKTIHQSQGSHSKNTEIWKQREQKQKKCYEEHFALRRAFHDLHTFTRWGYRDRKKENHIEFMLSLKIILFDAPHMQKPKQCLSINSSQPLLCSLYLHLQVKNIPTKRAQKKILYDETCRPLMIAVA